MAQDTYRAYHVREGDDGRFTGSVESLRTADLNAEAGPDALLIRVEYSSLNYKDAMSASGNRGVTRTYPHTPGIDAAGVVEESTSDAFPPGTPVVVTGNDLGENTPGGWAQYIRVPATSVLPLPANLTARCAMAYGTAGLTAAMCVDTLRRHDVLPESGDVLVTGASGGVGSIATRILLKAGYRVTAATGKGEARRELIDLGVSEVLPRKELIDETGRPMLSGRWAGVVDTAGGPLLETAIRETKPWGALAICGNVASEKISTTVYPFILRGIALVGVASSRSPMAQRKRLWDMLAGPWRPDDLSDLAREVTLDDLSAEVERSLRGEQRGRVIVNVND